MGLYDDEFEGVGGSYLVDPKTGKRARVEEPTAPPQQNTPPESQAGTPAGAQPVEAAPVAGPETAQPAPAPAAAQPGADVHTTN